jgi:hypothetical protein
MNDFEISRTTFYKEREVITATEFSVLIKGYPSYIERLTRSKENFPALAVKRGKREYFYLDDLLAWYELLLEDRARRAEETAKKFERAREVAKLRRETNKESRQALLDAIRK